MLPARGPGEAATTPDPPASSLHLPTASGRERKPGDSLSWPIHKMETMLLPRPPRGSLASVSTNGRGRGVLGVLQCGGRQRATDPRPPLQAGGAGGPDLARTQLVQRVFLVSIPSVPGGCSVPDKCPGVYGERGRLGQLPPTKTPPRRRGGREG